MEEAVLGWVGGFCQLQNQGFAPGEGQIEWDQPSQYTAALYDPIWNMACGSRLCTLQDNNQCIQVNSARGTLKAKRNSTSFNWCLDHCNCGLKSYWTGVRSTWLKHKSKTSHKWSSPLATLAEKLGRTIFSQPQGFGGKNAKNLGSSQRWSFWWMNSLRSFLCFFYLICIKCGSGRVVSSIMNTTIEVLNLFHQK